MINAYTVIGQPIAHSLSPLIHGLFGQLTQRRVRYTRTEATPETFEAVVRAWREDGGRGCNVTMPFKEQAHAMCDRSSGSAARAGSVNTLQFHRDGAIVGHNTDGEGLRVDIERNLSCPIAGTRVLLLGAGGAARGALGPLLDARPAGVWIANRTVARAQAILEAFGDDPAARGVPLGACSLDALTAHVAGHGGFDLVINATSLSLSGELPPLPEELFADGALAYDMAYGPRDTVFMRWSREHGARVAGGFGMLVEQAAESFQIWEGVRPKTHKAWGRLQELLNAA